MLPLAYINFEYMFLLAYVLLLLPPFLMLPFKTFCNRQKMLNIDFLVISGKVEGK